MRSLMRRLSAGVLGVAAIATMATLVTTAPASHIYSASIKWPTVRPGTVGERVNTVQFLLQGRGYRLVADGHYGRTTTAAVRSFQKRSGLHADGIVGPSTWAKLIVTVKFGSRGPAVTAVQHSLRFAYGYKAQLVTGFFGAATRTVVKAFQHSSRLPVDGVVGTRTWKTLVVFEK